MSDLFHPTLPDMIAEVERECSLRERVYPRMVNKGQMTNRAANLQLSRMRGVLQFLRDHQPK